MARCKFCSDTIIWKQRDGRWIPHSSDGDEHRCVITARKLSDGLETPVTRTPGFGTSERLDLHETKIRALGDALLLLTKEIENLQKMISPKLIVSIDPAAGPDLSAGGSAPTTAPDDPPPLIPPEEAERFIKALKIPKLEIKSGIEGALSMPPAPLDVAAIAESLKKAIDAAPVVKAPRKKLLRPAVKPPLSAPSVPAPKESTDDFDPPPGTPA